MDYCGNRLFAFGPCVILLLALSIFFQWVAWPNNKHIEVSNGNSCLSGAGQADWLVRYGLSVVCVRKTHAAGQVRFV